MTISYKYYANWQPEFNKIKNFEQHKTLKKILITFALCIISNISSFNGNQIITYFFTISYSLS